MKKIMETIDRAENLFEFAFVMFIFMLLIVMLTGCELCDCSTSGTLKLREPGGEYTRVCHGRYEKNSHDPKFVCDEGAVIYRPTNFIVVKSRVDE